MKLNERPIELEVAAPDGGKWTVVLNITDDNEVLIACEHFADESGDKSVEAWWDPQQRALRPRVARDPRWLNMEARLDTALDQALAQLNEVVLDRIGTK